MMTRGTVTKPNDTDLNTLSQLAERMQIIQDEITSIEIEERAAMDVVNLIRQKKVALKKALIAPANLRAGIACDKSRQRHYNISADEMRIHANAYLRDN